MFETHEIVRLVADSMMVMLIWLVQAIIYPAFHTLEEERFAEWHHHYMRTISFIVIPLMCVQTGIVGFQCLELPVIGNLISAAAVLIAWVVTFTLSVPCHKKLQASGKDPVVIDRLIRTNWIRTMAWTVVLLSGLLK